MAVYELRIPLNAKIPADQMTIPLPPEVILECKRLIEMALTDCDIDTFIESADASKLDVRGLEELSAPRTRQYWWSLTRN